MGWVAEILKKISRRRDDRKIAEQESAQKSLLLKNISRFQQLTGYSIKNQDIFVLALLHRSFLQRPGHSGHSNERLEFLGDSVLNLVVAEYLYNAFPLAEEGELTKIRSRLVNRKALAAYAKEIHLMDFIFMSTSAAQSIGKGYDTIIADTYEAVIAAIYLDGGHAESKRFVERQVLAAMKSGTVVTDDENYKSLLLEHAQGSGLGVPRYVIVKEEGPDHDRTFTIDVLVNSVRLGSGTGKNKKEAEQAAACRALEELHKQ
ncbi:MAG TPA: ribonuclease III [Bacteroidetes bacterium]|jgi:ribonuclease III|nr:ribonuclease III [Bacteroidota bacterium]